jgi:hypothetical protein
VLVLCKHYKMLLYKLTEQSWVLDSYLRMINGH